MSSNSYDHELGELGELPIAISSILRFCNGTIFFVISIILVVGLLSHFPSVIISIMSISSEKLNVSRHCVVKDP